MVIRGRSGNNGASLEPQCIVIENMIDNERHPSPRHFSVLRCMKTCAFELLDQRLARRAVEIPAQ